MKPGRQSSASLATVTVLPMRGIDRPADLTAEQSAVWSSVMQSKPVDWFDAGSAPLLQAYCRAVVESRKIATLVEAMPANKLLIDDGLIRYRELRKIQGSLAGEVSSLARAMRLTQQAKYRADAAAVANKKPSGIRPWHTGN